MNPERKPSKPPPPPIIEQFRSRLRERERLGPVGTLDVVSLYEEALVELNRNSKPVISGLSFIAGEQREHAEGIATVICDRILKVPKEQKLPSLYLLDSIVKNVGSEYLRYFAARLPEVFLETYRKLNSSFHPAMLHLFRTWLPYFPSLVLGKIEVSLHENQKPASSGDLRHSGSQSPHQLHGNDVNLKYLGVQHQSEHFAVDARRTIPPRLDHEVLSSRPGFESIGPAAMGAVEDILPYPRPSSPPRIGLQIDVDRASLSGIGSGRTSDGNGALARSWPSGDGEENVEASGAHNNDNGPDKLRARYLIDAYGGKNSSHEKPPKFQRLCFAGTSSDVATEDMRSSGEELVLETMSPTLSSQSKRYSPTPFGYNTGLTRSNAPYLGNDFESDQDNRAFLPRFDDPASITRANQPSFLARHQFDADDRTNLNSVSLYEMTPPNTPPFQPSLHTFHPLHVPPLHPVPRHPAAAAAAPHPSATLHLLPLLLLHLLPLLLLLLLLFLLIILHLILLILLLLFLLLLPVLVIFPVFLLL